MAGSAALPVERSYLLRAWLAVVAIVVISAAVVALALATGAAPAGGTDPVNLSTVSGVQDPQEPILVNGAVCRQCR